MIEELTGIGKRLLELRAKLKAREGHKAYAENVKQIKAEIVRLEAITLEPAVLASDKKLDL